MGKIFCAFIGPTGFRTARVFENGAELEHYGAFLSDALESDFQSAESCVPHIRSVLDVLQSKLPFTEWAGNAYEIRVTNEVTNFSNELTGDSGGEIPTYEYLSALLFWSQFLTSPDSPVEHDMPNSREEVIHLAVAFCWGK